MTELRHCKVCKFVKELTDFYESNQSKCKDCVKRAVNDHRAANIESIRAYDRERGKLPHRIEKAANITRQWRADNPKAWKAHIDLNNAIRIGTITRQPCFICGGKAVAHHPNYDAPLDVVWLCQAHHKQAHALARKAA